MTKIYLISTLIVFDILNFVHYGVYLEGLNTISTFLKANVQIFLKIDFTIAFFFLFQYFFQRVLKGMKEKERWLKIVKFIFEANVVACIAFLIYNVVLVSLL